MGIIADLTGTHVGKPIQDVFNDFSFVASKNAEVGIPERDVFSLRILKKIKTKREGKWRVSTIRGILKNRFCTGRVEFEGTFIRAQHDAIISDVIFRK